MHIEFLAGLFMLASDGAASVAGHEPRDCYGVPKRSEAELAKAVSVHARAVGLSVSKYDFHSPEPECREGVFVWIISAWGKPGMPPGVHDFVVVDADMSLYKHVPSE